MSFKQLLSTRAAVFGLASTSFACLLGHFYGFWTMRDFACVVLLPATALLAYIAWATRRQSGGAATWIIEGALGGIVAAVAYDLFRLPFVLNGYPLFKVFPEFGRMLMGAPGPEWLAQLLGWTYHFSNGAALGIMLLTMLPRPTPRALFRGAVLWALVVEIILLNTPYVAFFKIKLDFTTFLILTVSAHLVFGVVLGLWLQRRLGRLSAVG